MYYRSPVTSIALGRSWLVALTSILMNKKSALLGSNRQSHFTSYFNNLDGASAGQKLWYGSVKLRREYLNKRAGKLYRSGNGPVQGVINRMEAVTSKNDGVNLSCRQCFTGQNLVDLAQATFTCQLKDCDIKVFHNELVGFCEPVVDREALFWKLILFQFVRYPVRDIKHNSFKSKVQIFDVNIK